MSRDPDRSNVFGVDLPSWTDFEVSSEAIHLRSFGRLVEGGLLAAAAVAAGGDGWVPDLDGLVQLTAGGHLARGSDERIVGLRLRPRTDVAANDEDADAIPNGSMFREALPVSRGRVGGFASDVRCWDDLAPLRVVGPGELIADEVYLRLARHGGRADRVQVREAVAAAVDVAWASAWPVDVRNSAARLAQLRRVALPERGICEGSAAGVLTWESSGWPGATGILPTAQLNVGVDVADDGVISGRGLPWPAALIPFSEHDPPLVIADGARAIERAMTPARPEPPRVSGGFRGSPIIGADVLVALVPLNFSDPAVIVSSDLIGSARLSCVDESGQVRALGLGDVLVDRHGSGGVVAEVRASRELPRLADGRPVDILVDPVHVVRWGRFGTLSEVEAATRDIYDPVGDRPIDALAGILHVLRQARTVERRTDVTAIQRATLESVGWEDNTGTPGIVVHAVVPDPELSSDLCCLPRSLWPGDSPAAALLVGSRPCAIRGYRVVPVDGEVARVPATARSLFVTPWSGEPVTVTATTEEHAAALHSPTKLAIDRTVTVQRVTLAALQPAAVKSVFSSVPATLLEIAQQFERGIITDEERTEHSAAKLTLIFQEIEQTLREEATRAPQSLPATLSRAGVGMWRLAPLLVDREGRAGGPWLADYINGVSAAVMCAAVAPSGAAVDWPTRAFALTKRLIDVCSGMRITETDCGRSPLSDGVRFPLECRTTSGVCATCVGATLDKTSVPSVGTPVGMLGALALSRELPDLWLHTFHVCGTHLPAEHGLLRFEELIDGTQPPAAAILAERDGVVRVADDRLTLLDTLGTEVQTIARSRGRPLFAVNDGVNIETGAPLTLGPVPLGDLARLRGPAAVDRYVVDDMVSLLEGRDVAATLIECVVRAIRVTWPWAADRP